LVTALSLGGVCVRGSIPLPAINTNNIIFVTNAAYGAVGDGVFTNTTAIQNAINKATTGGMTNGLFGGTVEIPSGIFLCGPLTLKNNVNLQIDAGGILRMLPFGQYPMNWFTNNTTNVYFVVTGNFISGSSLTNIEISGSGAIDGQGLPWWPWAYTNNAVRPVMISLTSCNRELIQNVTLSNSPAVHIGLGSGSGNTIVQYITERAPSSYVSPNPSHNTDACDIRGTNTLVQFNNVSVGDDDFSCLGNTSDAVISNNVYGDGHGTSIGSQIAGGVSNFVFINCIYTNTDACAHIKSDRDRGGFIHNINYYNLTFTNVMHPIQIYCEYTNKTIPAIDSVTPGAAAALAAVPITTTTPYYRDITISNFTGNAQSTRAAGLIWGLPESSISNVTLVKVNLTGSKTFGIYDAKNIQIIDSTHNVPAGVSQYSFFDADVTFSNSISSVSVVTLDGVTTNGIANSFKFYNSLMTLKNTNAMGLNSSVTLGASTFIISNNLALSPSNSLNFILGTNAATIVVKGNLALGGTNNISSGGGFTNGSYLLMTYTGTLGGSLPTLGVVPASYNYSFDTNTAGQVKLVVAIPPPPAPANLMATATNLLINLKWNSVSGAASYNLKRGTTSGGSYPTIFGGLTTTNYADSSVTNAINYFYVVSAVAGGESTNSLQANAIPLPSNQPTNIVLQASRGQLQLSWPQNHLGWRLQIQTNNLNSGIGTNWFTVPNSTNIIQTNLVINPTNDAVFLRLVYP
jgi:polygalacturonase